MRLGLLEPTTINRLVEKTIQTLLFLFAGAAGGFQTKTLASL
jgi:hypothetical protein